ncbi:MAG TPA: hypothetical protein EYQ83_07555 [Acidobacteria bacterium]|nr:hypothetical protein [Acidobacteriota bacterium]
MTTSTVSRGSADARSSFNATTCWPRAARAPSPRAANRRPWTRPGRATRPQTPRSRRSARRPSDFFQPEAPPIGGQVYGSADAGDTWTSIVNDLPRVQSVEVQTLP